MGSCRFQQWSLVDHHSRGHDLRQVKRIEVHVHHPRIFLYSKPWTLVWSKHFAG